MIKKDFESAPVPAKVLIARSLFALESFTALFAGGLFVFTAIFISGFALQYGNAELSGGALLAAGVVLLIIGLGAVYIAVMLKKPTPTLKLYAYLFLFLFAFIEFITLDYVWGVVAIIIGGAVWWLLRETEGDTTLKDATKEMNAPSLANPVVKDPKSESSESHADEPEKNEKSAESSSSFTNESDKEIADNKKTESPSADPEVSPGNEDSEPEKDTASGD